LEEINMKPNTIPLLCDPITHEPLRLDVEPGPDGSTHEVLVSVRSGQRFLIRDGIPLFLRDSDVTGQNKKYQELYNRMAPLYDLMMRSYAFLRSGGEGKRRGEYLRELEIEAGDRVLEVSIGTGGNLRYLPRMARYFGLDISGGMLKRCQRNLKAWGMEAELFLGAAEALPFNDQVFDVVFHMGGINFFNDKAHAINEMIRVAKPGTKILVVDETERQARSAARVPGAYEFYGNRKEVISAPVDLVPPEMQDVVVKDIWAGELYCLTFRKPLVESTHRWEPAATQRSLGARLRPCMALE
jgi:ubiquinone/menaquinone biosynthesis C-methylase UbiE